MIDLKMQFIKINVTMMDIRFCKERSTQLQEHRVHKRRTQRGLEVRLSPEPELMRTLSMGVYKEGSHVISQRLRIRAKANLFRCGPENCL